MNTLCPCGTPTRDDATLCDRHAGELTQALAEVPFLAQELETSMAREKSSAGVAGGATGGLHYDEQAGDALRALHACLVGWVRFCDAENIRHQSPRDELPADTLAALSRWLLWRVDGLTFHELGADAWEEITNACADARRVAFRKPLPRVYLGVCTRVIDSEECGHAVYAVKGTEVGRCVAPDCRMEYAVGESQQRLEAHLDSRLCTAAEIARLSTYLGLDAGRERVRKQINLWHKRGRIAAHSTTEAGDPRFQYGEVRVMLAATYQVAESERVGA